MRTARVLRVALIALAVATLAACVPPELTPLPSPTPAGPVPSPDATISAPEVVPAVLAEIPIGPITTPDSIAFSAATGEVWGPSDDSVVVLDAASRQVVDEIRLGVRPGAILVDDAAGLVYVAEVAQGVGGITVLLAATHEVLDRIELIGTIGVGRMALDLATRRLFVAAGDSGVAVVDTDTRDVLGFVPVGPRPRGIGVDPDLGLAFVSDGDGITAIDTADLEVVDRFSIGAYPRLSGYGRVAVDEEASLLYALNEAWGTITVVDTTSRQVVRVLRCGDRAPGGPFDIAIDAAARRAYVTGCRQWAVGVIDLDSLNVIQLLRPADATPDGFQTLGIAVAVDPATGTVFLTSDGMVRVVSSG